MEKFKFLPYKSFLKEKRKGSRKGNLVDMSNGDFYPGPGHSMVKRSSTYLLFFEQGDFVSMELSYDEDDIDITQITQ